MRNFLVGPIVVAILAAAACGDSRSPGSSPSPPPFSGDTIRGTERLGWDQFAASQAELRTFSYAIYVDSTRSVMSDTTCGGSVTLTGFACSGRLPPMTPGLHTIEIAAFITVDGVVTESPRSTPLRVNVSPAVMVPASRTDPDDATPAAPAANRLVRVARSFEGFEDTGDIAVAPDGRIFVVERRGVVRMIEGGVTDPRPVLLAGERLLSIALDPEFERTRLVYALQADPNDENGGTLRLVRYREAGGAFGERAVILENIQGGTEPLTGSARVGPDGRLYVTTIVTASDRAGPSDGRLLRVEKDGTTPADQPPGDVVYARGFAVIHGFDWQPGAASIWIGDGSPVFDRLSPVLADPRRARQRTAGAEHRLAPGTRIAALRFYDGEAVPALRNTLLVAAETGLLSVRFDRRNPLRITAVETLIDAPMRAIATGPAGVYVASDSTVFLLERAR
jgi:glucose/arabinose dehydrogenase